MANPTNNNPRTQIVKVQVPLVTSGDPSLCLVYDRDRKHYVEQAIPQKARDALKGDARAFFEATFFDGEWHLYRRAPEQFW